MNEITKVLETVKTIHFIGIGGSGMCPLAEILHTFPILFTRLDLNRGLKAVVTAMALGKLVGALFYFYYRYSM